MPRRTGFAATAGSFPSAEAGPSASPALGTASHYPHSGNQQQPLETARLARRRRLLREEHRPALRIRQVHVCGMALDERSEISAAIQFNLTSFLLYYSIEILNAVLFLHTLGCFGALFGPRACSSLTDSAADLSCAPALPIFDPN